MSKDRPRKKSREEYDNGFKKRRHDYDIQYNTFVRK